MHVDIEGKRLGIGCGGNDIHPLLLSVVFVVVGSPPTRPVIPTRSNAPAPTTHDGNNNDNIDNEWRSRRSSLPGRVRATRARVSVWRLSSRDATGKRTRTFRSEMREQANEARRQRCRYNCVSGGLHTFGCTSIRGGEFCCCRLLFVVVVPPSYPLFFCQIWLMAESTADS